MLIARFLVADGFLDKLQCPLARSGAHAVGRIEQENHVDSIAPIGHRWAEQRDTQDNEQCAAQR
jgi:hypothetical protein